MTGCNGDLGEAIGRTIKESPANLVAHGTDASGTWPGRAIFGSVDIVPFADDDNYCQVIEKVCAAHAIDAVIPTTDAELRVLSACTDPIKGMLYAPSAEIVNTFGDKLATARWFTEIGLPFPATSLLGVASPDDLPLIVKPRRGSGSKGLYVVRNPNMLHALQSTYGDSHIAQTYLADDSAEFTCAIFRSGTVTRTLIMRRQLDAGRTIKIRVESQPAIAHLLDSIAQATDLSGSINVQLRLVDQLPIVFEINPRFSSTVRMRHLIGFKDLLWSLSPETLAEPYDAPAPGTEVYRMSSELVVGANEGN